MTISELEETGGEVRLECDTGCPEHQLRTAFGLDLPAALRPEHSRMADGGSFIFEAPEKVDAVWGQDDQVLWAQGEPLMLLAPDGVGKTTLAQQLALLRAGIKVGDLLGLPVDMDPNPVLYIAADRPLQAARSFRRMVGPDDRQGCELGLKVWKGPLPFDIGHDPDAFPEFIQGIGGVGTVFIDSLKDVAVGLAEKPDQVGGNVNRALQHVVAEGIEVVTLHHPRKATSENKKPKTLDDMYGSRLIYAGCGSVAMLWGQPGDLVVELRHLKQPAAEVGPLSLLHDHATGTTTIHESVDVLELVKHATNGGLTVRDVAVQMYGNPDPNRNEIEKARRKLDGLVGRRLAHRIDGESKTPTVYRPVESRMAA